MGLDLALGRACVWVGVRARMRGSVAAGWVQGNRGEERRGGVGEGGGDLLAVL